MIIDRKLMLVAAAFAGSVTAAPVPENSGVLKRSSPSGPGAGFNGNGDLTAPVDLDPTPAPDPFKEWLLSHEYEGAEKRSASAPDEGTDPGVNAWLLSMGQAGGVKRSAPVPVGPTFVPYEPIEVPEQVQTWLNSIEQHEPTQKRSTPSTNDLASYWQRMGESLDLPGGWDPVPAKKRSAPSTNNGAIDWEHLDEYLNDPSEWDPVPAKEKRGGPPAITPQQWAQIRQWISDAGPETTIDGGVVKRSGAPPDITPQQWAQIEQWLSHAGAETTVDGGVVKRDNAPQLPPDVEAWLQAKLGKLEPVPGPEDTRKREVSPQQFQQEIQNWIDGVCKGKTGPVHVGPGYIGGGYDITCP